MLNDQDDGTTGRQDDKQSSPVAFGTRGTNARQPVSSSSCRPFVGTAELAGSNGRPGQKKIGELSLVVMTGRKNSMGGMASGPWN